MKITVVGTGYVGLSNAILLAQNNEVWAVDILEDKVDKINKHISPIVDKEIEEYLENKELNLTATLNAKQAYIDADYIIISTPTNYDSLTDSFDTSAVEAVIADISKYNSKAIIVIKSTIPVGYTEMIRKKVNNENIIFS